MALALSVTDLAQLEATTRTFASPLVFGDVDAWRGEERPHLVHGLDDTARCLLDTYMAPAWGDTGAGPDPMLDLFCQTASERALEAWDNAYADYVLGGGGEAKKSLFWNEVVVPVGSEDSQSLFVATPRGAVQLSIYSLRRVPGPGQHVPLLRVLLPTLKAGLDALFRLDAHRAALDAVAEPLVAFTADGCEVYRSAPLRRLIAADPEGAAIERALAELTLRVRPLAFIRQRDTPAVAMPTADIRTTRACYALRAALLPPGAFGLDESFLVTVVPTGSPAAFPAVDEVRARHGLTEREAEVALLVAQGLPNDAIAERLFVSRPTVRHHVEGAMAKLELTGRGRETVAPRLLGAEVA